MKKLLILLLVPSLIFNCSNDDSVSEDPPQSACDNGTFSGIVRLETQSEVDAFGALCYTKIDGTLVIGTNEGVESDISDLSPLSNLNEVLILNAEMGSGKILIMNTSSLVDLNGLQNITKASGLLVSNNIGLINFSGLEGLRELNNLEHSGSLSIDNNSQLQNIDGLQNLSVIGSEESDLSSLVFMNIQSNANLENLDGLANLESVYGTVSIGSYVEDYNPELGNSSLTDYCGLYNLVNNGHFTYVNIFNNAFNPTNQDILDGNCSQ